MSSMRDPNKPKSVIGIRNYISSLYECINFLIFVNFIAHYKCVYAYYLCFPLSVKLSTGFQSV